MPELPEVETTLRGILPHIGQQVIARAEVREHRLRWPIPLGLQGTLAGRTIVNGTRRGKYLLLETDGGTLLIHLGMSGSLRILAGDTLPARHDHVDLVFHNNRILRFTDPRRFGAFLWVTENPEAHPLLKGMGVEPLTRGFSGKYLWLRAQARKVPVKSFLMDGRVVAGIGNIYATEALFAAGIHPTKPAGMVSLAHFSDLVQAAKKILRAAIRQGGTTLKDFVGSDGRPGYFAMNLRAYGRAGMACTACSTPLQSMWIGQRGTVFCGKCQC